MIGHFSPKQMFIIDSKNPLIRLHGQIYWDKTTKLSRADQRKIGLLTIKFMDEIKHVFRKMVAEDIDENHNSKNS